MIFSNLILGEPAGEGDARIETFGVNEILKFGFFDAAANNGEMDVRIFGVDFGHNLDTGGVIFLRNETTDREEIFG